MPSCEEGNNFDGDRSRLDSVLGAGVLLEFAEADGAACVHVLNASADAFEYPGFFGRLEKLLLGGGVLYDRFGLAVDGEDDRRSRLLQMINEFRYAIIEV